VRGTSGTAGEFGHVSINENGPRCKCGNQGCWEVYASNSAAIDEYVRATAGARTKKSGAVEKPTFEDILYLAEQGDAKAIEAIEHMAHYLGIGLAMLVTGIAPSVIVLIGEVTRAWKRIDPVIKRVLKERLPSGQTGTQILPAEDILQPRLRGSIALILQKHFGAPATA
jgi:predicted NBD/HSP70 family sugar kinase